MMLSTLGYGSDIFLIGFRARELTAAQRLVDRALRQVPVRLAPMLSMARKLSGIIF
jgi:hypothetical protein